MKEFPGRYAFSVSHTTRLPRPNETQGVQYHFTTVDRFKEEIAAGAFIEWAVYAGNYYGTTVAALANVKEKGQIALLDIDLQVACSVLCFGFSV
jgi:guanylate kinase